MTRFDFHGLRAVGLLSILAGACGIVAADDTVGYDRMSDWRGWARTEAGLRAGLASSTDRAGENDDFSQYDDPTGLIYDEVPCTVRTLSGPGIIHRFWMPHLTARRKFTVRMYFDGEETPRIDTNSDAILSGKFGYFAAPLVDTCAGGQVCYEPIAFAESLRIETVNKELPRNGDWNANRHYYQYTYTLFPADAEITSYDGSLSETQEAARSTVAAMLQAPGDHPAGADPDAIRITTAATDIAAGAEINLADLVGPGIGRAIHLRLDSATDAALDGLHLVVVYDDDAEPAIEVAVSDFFGAGHDRATYRSLPLGTDGAEGYFCYWPMPFQRRLRVTLENRGSEAVALASAAVEYAVEDVAPTDGYLRAAVNESVHDSGNETHPLLARVGRGHYVGNLLYVSQDADSFFMLEGDEQITVDDEPIPGTGLEDAYNGGYYYNWVGIQSDEPEGGKPRSAIRPLSGILLVDRGGSPKHAWADQYRWMIADRVAFQKSIDVRVEMQYSEKGARWRSVAFWYERPVRRGDLNCDGNVDFGDIDPFVQVLIDPGGYEAAFPDCDVRNADIDRSGATDFNDIDLFVECLIAGECP